MINRYRLVHRWVSEMMLNVQSESLIYYININNTYNEKLLFWDLVTVTFAHHSLIQGNRSGALYGLVYTVILAIIFTAFQAVEYTVSSFTISDGTYTSCFYFSTGFHGLHVIIGTAFLSVGLWRLFAYHLTDNHHQGLESAILYWHFVDVIWLFLYISIYYWGS